MRPRFAFLILAFGALLALSACSASAKPVADSTGHVTTTVTATVTAPAPAPVTVTVTATKTRTIVRTVKPKPKRTPNDGYTYKIDATSGSAGTVTYTEGGSIEQATGVSLPWTKTVTGCGILCEVSAQNAGSGTVTCAIFAPDGRRVDKHSSTGAYAIASCQYQP